MPDFSQAGRRGAYLDTVLVCGVVRAANDRRHHSPPVFNPDFPDCLPDGGSRSAARVVPGHSGRHWTIEITSSNRMKEK